MIALHQGSPWASAALTTVYEPRELTYFDAEIR